MVPLERWHVDGFGHDKPEAMEARFGSFVSGAQCFDAAAFGISRSEALHMDPQQRVVLQHAAEALSCGGLVGHTSSSSAEHTGVMVGIGSSEYLSMAGAALPMGLYTATGGAISVAAGR